MAFLQPKIFFLVVVALISALMIFLLYNENALLTSQRSLALDFKLERIHGLEESLLSILETLNESSYTIQTDVVSVKTQLNETLQTLAQKDARQQRFERDQRKSLENVQEQQEEQLLQLSYQLERSASPRRTNRYRVFDVTLLNDELDLLEVRLGELYDLLDVMVVIESEFTISGRPKKLVFQENEPRFRRYREKLLHIVVPPMTAEVEGRYYGQWKYESYLRNEGMRLAIQSRRPHDGDWLMIADMDELPRREFITQLQNPDLSTALGRRLSEESPETVGDVFRITCHFYLWSYEYRVPRDTVAPVLMRYRDEDSPIFARDDYKDMSLANSLRQDQWRYTGQRLRREQHGKTDILLGQCRHCSYCFPKLEMILNKIRSYAHQEFNLPENTDPKTVLGRARSGVDVFNRYTENMDYIKNNQDVPDLIRLNPKKYRFMLKRRGLPNAGFEDVPMNTSLFDPKHPFIDPPEVPKDRERPSNDEYMPYVKPV
ncbi:hypothetical protein BGZ83_002165 [Gryganskiella cystojenkinii]|nr:hypothetical protein BGZ83_002165 [Gryganskiella cystojenkinii]